jgi:hypothetical protein
MSPSWSVVADVAPPPWTPASPVFWIVGSLLLFVAAVFWLFVRAFRAATSNARVAFQEHRPKLEAEFFRAAATSGKPRGLRWTACEWTPGVEFARNKTSGQLTALVGVTIQFEAIPGSDMEGLPAVGNLRNASAVFFHDRGKWRTTGRAVFNLNPDEVLSHFAGQYDRVSTT